MSETLGVYNVGIPRPQPPPSFEVQLKALPPAVRSGGEITAMRRVYLSGRSAIAL
jgi:hypothetical protein